MKIRNATVRDCKLIAEIDIHSNDPLIKLFPIKKEELMTYFRKLIKENKVKFFLYGKEGVVGIKKDFPGYNHLELFWLTVTSGAQNKGIGTKLVRYIESYAKKLDYRAIYLYTHPIHKQAIKFYKNLGYKKISEFPNYYSNGNKSLLFGKKLLKK